MLIKSEYRFISKECYVLAVFIKYVDLIFEHTDRDS